MKGIPVVDCWINLNAPQSRLGGSVGYLFTEAQQRLHAGASTDELVASMKAVGIRKALLTIDPTDPKAAYDAIDKYPDIFFGALKVNPHNGHAETRLMEDAVRNHNVKAFRVSGHYILKPYNDKIYYPIYSKCIDLDIPITANVGIPGPRVPGEYQNPIHLDEVCWFFPDLKVVMTHIGEPWQFTCVKMLLKWDNLFYMTSAFAPKYYPKEIIDYMNTRGSKKIMFASDYPLIHFERCMKEIPDLPIREHVLEPFLKTNAERVFRI